MDTFTGALRRALHNRVLLALVGVLAIGAIWQATIAAYDLAVIVLPSPLRVIDALLQLVRTAAFWKDVGVSLYEFAGGYVTGMVLGVGTGLLMAESRYFRMT